MALTKEKRSELFAQKMQSVGETQRLRIICLLSNESFLCVSAVAKALDISVANASHHLRALSDVGVLTHVREGKQVCYSLSSDAFTQELKKFICTLKII